MTERKYDPKLPYRYIRYGRMSDRKQNRRSPDQQFTTIDETLKRCSYPWQCIRTYRDDGITGRLVRKRPQFQKMLRDIEAGLIKPDLIAVDTLERLGRAEEVAELRRKLAVKYGVLVVATDNNFADPTGVVGKAVGMIESIRSTEDCRIKRHNVIRGKKDTARRKRWPGGPRPFGYRLKPMIDDSSTPPEVYHVLEPEPREFADMQLAFQQAAATGYGDSRMANWWNNSPDIPDDFKTIDRHIMAYRLENPIYIGTLRWGENCTDVVDDMRVIRPNPEDEVVYVPEFCEPAVSKELYAQVQGLREARSRAALEARQQTREAGPEKLIAPQAKGLALKYPLTGLVRCALCGASMSPGRNKSESKHGKQYQYVYYHCPRHPDGICPNSRFVREDQLREAAISRFRGRLFPPPEYEGEVPAWLPEMGALVRHELERLRQDEPDPTKGTSQELRDLEVKLKGWAITLGNPDLPASVRADIVAQYDSAKSRMVDLEQATQRRRALQEKVEQVFDPQAVVDQLHQLAEVLAGYNPTLTNLELSKHIDRIDCYPDGRVELRGTYLGVFDNAVELLSGDIKKMTETQANETGFQRVKPRRRTKLRVPDLSAESQELAGTIDLALDPQRFAGVPEPFMWTESFVMLKRKSWAEDNALEVAWLRIGGMTNDALAKHFGKTFPTIRSALRWAVRIDPSLKDRLPKKISRRRWAKEHAAEILELKQQGMCTDDIAKHFGKSDTTIRAALKHSQELPAPPATVSESPPDADGKDDAARSQTE